MNDDPVLGAMDPQHQLIYMLGEVKGELRAMHASLDATNARQATVNVEFGTKLGEHDKEIAAHGEALAVLRANEVSRLAGTPPRMTWPQVITGVGGVGALVILILTLFPNFTP